MTPFLQKLRNLCALSALYVALPALAQAAQVQLPAETTQIVIDSHQSGPRINKHIYGQFAEHLGRGIYDGIWVGRDSDIPNIRGFRKDVIEALKAIKVPLVRWPGGCFADEYHWRDGIGPRSERPVRINSNWGGVTENNHFGTHEFFDLVELLGAEAYVNGNLGTGSPREMAEWLTYITDDSTSELAELRRKNGRDKPWQVAYFGVGNEAWGCGGNMRPEYYADLYRHYGTFLKAPSGSRPKLVASGGTGEDTRWTDVLSQQIDQNINGISFHYYTLPTGDWSTKGQALGFQENDWIATLWRTLQMDEFIRNNKAVLDQNDPDQKLGLYVDEWGTWYDPEAGADRGELFQQNTLRDAVVAALNLNIFHRHADRVHMTNIAQMVNVLQAMILTEEDRMVLTPTYHVFGMYSVFQDATSLPLTLSQVPVYQHQSYQVPALSASAARGQDGKLYLALVNLDAQRAHPVHVQLKDGHLSHAKGQLLTANGMDAHNDFKHPKQIEPSSFEARVQNQTLSLTVPAKSVLVLALTDQN